MVRPYFSQLSIFKMTKEELQLADYVNRINKNIIKEKIKKSNAVKIRRRPKHHKNKEWFIIVSKSFDKEFTLRATFFDHLGPSCHYDRETVNEIVDIIYTTIPKEVEYLTQIETV